MAYGIFAKGVVTYWPLEVALFAVLWGLRGPLFKTWSYRTDAIEANKVGMRQSVASFVVFQALLTAILVFAIAFIVILVRKLLTSE